MMEERLSIDDGLRLVQALIHIRIIRESFRGDGIFRGIVLSIQIERMICDHVLKVFKKKFDGSMPISTVFDWFIIHYSTHQAINDFKMKQNIFVSLMTLSSYHKDYNDSNRIFDLMISLIDNDQEKKTGVIDFNMAHALLKHIKEKKDQCFHLTSMPYGTFEYLVRDKVVDPIIENKEYRKLLRFFSCVAAKLRMIFFIMLIRYF